MAGRTFTFLAPLPPHTLAALEARSRSFHARVLEAHERMIEERDAARMAETHALTANANEPDAIAA